MSSLPYRYQSQSQYQPGVAAPAPAMSSQRFCLRWNNHQSNLLSVFDQLLHDESFVDVTLAVEGHLLKAHKMILSACSPYFQTLFINHPDKHPIVILKDVPYADMRCLLDFMYRGEVSVDQDRLTAFLRVAESLRIKGLTEVNEEKCDTIASSLTQQNLHNNLPHLHRLQQNKRFGNNLNMLSNALLQPKRKRGRPRKLSGCSNGPDDYEKDIVQGSPEMLEVKMGMDNFTGNNSDSSLGRADTEDGVKVKEETEPVAGTSKDQQNYSEQTKDSEEFTPSEEYYDYHENNQNHTNLPSSITIEIMPSVKQESVIISTETARSLLQESEKIETEPNTGVHFLTDDDKTTEENYEKKKSELLEYLIRQDGTVVCKLCGEVLASRTHWYRHKYKLHVNNLVNPAPLFKCHHCNVFFKSRKGYTGHVAARHQDQNLEPLPVEENHHQVVVKEEVVETSVITTSKRKFEPKSSNWTEQRVKEEKLVADIIDRVRKECEAQGAAVSRRGYSRRSTSIMNSAA